MIFLPQKTCIVKVKVKLISSRFIMEKNMDKKPNMGG